MRAHFALRAALALCVGSALGCTKRPQSGNPNMEIADELPPWMTRGEEVRLDVARKLLETQNTVGALEILRAMREEGYDTPEMDILQGKALRIDGLYEEAERLLVRADGNLKKKDPRPASELCVLYADAKRVPEAIAQCRAAVTRDDASAQAWNNLGFLLLAEGDPQEALDSVARAVELDGTNPRFRNNLGLAQATLGRDEAAFRTFQSTLPKALAAFNVGVALERADDIDGALAYYERALSINPQLAEASAARDRLRPAADVQSNVPGKPNALPSASEVPGSRPTESPAGDPK